ncbi:MAG: winged helix-turn-helix domain-containing protein [Verrucomicrobiales bacterium]|jgi:ATP-dependent DNA helicase RecG|nr:winged helix-turn-helix domain-containing protein [Verrucomicrobiales bacterium]
MLSEAPSTGKTSVKILELLRENPQMSLAEVAAEVGRSLRAIEQASSKLVKTGKLRHIGPQKGVHWETFTP